MFSEREMLNAEETPGTDVLFHKMFANLCVLRQIASYKRSNWIES